MTLGPDGYAYVGELKGFPFTPGTSRVWRVSLAAHDVTCDPTATSGPCTPVPRRDDVDHRSRLRAGRQPLRRVDGQERVVRLRRGGGDTTGALYRVRHGVVTELAAGALTLPGGVAVGCDGTVFVTNNSVSSGGGQVLAIKP